MKEGVQLELFPFAIKKVTVELLKTNLIKGCRKCKYEKVCDYCGLDWTDITREIENSLKKEPVIDIEKEFSYENIERENSDIAEQFYLLAKRIDTDLNNGSEKYKALTKLLDLKNDVI